MSGSIKISKKHGLNPCIPICVFCGKEKNELALLGRLKDDAKAPMSAVIDMEPCNECKENWSKGVPLIRVTKKKPENGMPPLQKDGNDGIWPTAQYMVVTEECAESMFDLETKKGQPVLLEDVVFDKILKSAEDSGAQIEEK